MKAFLKKHQKNIFGSINGWDRLSIRGTIRWLSSLAGIGSYLSINRILHKDFGQWAESMTETIRSSCKAVADQLNIEKRYLQRSALNKEAIAKEIARTNGIESGPICMLSVVEPSYSPSVVGNRSSQKLEIQMRHRRCIWLYFYFNDPNWGLGHFRLQTWLPFTIKGCLNGREWLSRQMDQQGIDYIQSDNCFRWISDIDRAQELFDQQQRLDWNEAFENLAFPYFGVMKEVFGEQPLEYYWSVDESEWATDVMFRKTEDLDRLFPLLTRYGMDVTDSTNVLRFLGKIPSSAPMPGRLTGDLRSNRRRRYEGVRVKHWYDRNSIKMYNKAGNVLRVETTINNPRGFKVYRTDPESPQEPGKWTKMRKGISDIHRRSEVSQKANERYLESLAACESEMTLKQCTESVCQRTRLGKQPIRAMNPWNSEDYRLIEFLAQGQWEINGFRNKDLTAFIFDSSETHRTAKQKSSRSTRLIRMLRAHGLIKKVPRTHRYMLTDKGYSITALIKASSPVQAEQIIALAA